MPKSFSSRKLEGFDLLKEEICFVMRKHWAHHLFSVINWILLGPIISGLLVFIVSLFNLNFESKGGFIFLGFLFLYIAFITLQIFIMWLNKMYCVIIVTSDRVVGINQIDFFHRDIIETRLQNVQDATGSVKGLVSTIFNLGEITIHTANDMADFSISFIGNPHENARKIFDLANNARKNEVESRETIKIQHKENYRQKELLADQLKTSEKIHNLGL